MESEGVLKTARDAQGVVRRDFECGGGFGLEQQKRSSLSEMPAKRKGWLIGIRCSTQSLSSELIIGK